MLIACGGYLAIQVFLKIQPVSVRISVATDRNWFTQKSQKSNLLENDWLELIEPPIRLRKQARKVAEITPDHSQKSENAPNATACKALTISPRCSGHCPCGPWRGHHHHYHQNGLSTTPASLENIFLLVYRNINWSYIQPPWSTSLLFLTICLF